VIARFIAGTFFLSSFLFSLAAFSQTNFEVPRYVGPVLDSAGLLTPAINARLAVALDQIYKNGGSQIAVLTVDSLHDFPIEEASIKIVDQWKLGRKGVDDGILLLIAKDDHHMRIEVGRGKEGDLPDAWARRIIDEDMIPQFRAGDFEQGILLAVSDILKRTDSKVDFNSYFSGVYHRKSRGMSFGLFKLLLIMLFLFFHFVFSLGRRRSSTWGLWGGGFGGGLGGGGFGGGGGFSGGGSSGSW